MVRNDVHKAFLNNTMGTLFPGVPAAFQQWERNFPRVPVEMTFDAGRDMTHLINYQSKFAKLQVTSHQTNAVVTL